MKYKLKPGVLCCPSKRGIIENHDEEYPENYWDEDEAEERVKEGYLVRVEVKEKQKVKV